MNPQAILVRKFAFATSEYRQSVALRDRILREPLGRRLSSEELLSDAADVHIGAFIEERMLGSLILTRLPDRQIKMRQVAIDSSVQRLGIGRKLVEFSEAFARDLGVQIIVLNSREVAVPFYLRLGYEIEGDRFTEVSIPHFKMQKSLVSP